jgi:DNA polymerase III subunit gamma/tau
VVGQEPVVRTLRNAVERGKVHHAYLFVGSRGTGKTSMAKILAACLNCERGPTTEPCGECSSCLAIAAASSLDVIEMDAASNNSVDDIRDLRESVAYAPVSGRRKVYILDEAHMLSTAAWNAFLKTLEEPPPNTVFVLATTEAGKVPATVVDRCHRFDFHRPSVEQIATVIHRAAGAEGVTIPPAAVAALARSATGSFRDALGTLEQIITYGGTDVALDDVLAVLGVADAGLLVRTVDAIATGDSPAALRALESYVEQGRDAAGFAADLERHARELLLVQALGEVPAELSLTPESDEALAAQAARVDHAVAVRLLELLGEALEAVRAGADARTRLELALVKAARPEVDGSTRALLARIERLENGLAAAPVGAQPAQDQPTTAREASAAPTAPDAARADAPAQPPTVPAPPQEARQPAVATAPAAEADREETPQPERPRELASLTAVWPAVIDVVRGENALLGALMAEARPVALRGEELVAAFVPTAQFLKKKAERRANREVVLEALRAVTGVRWQISYELSDEVDDVEGGGPPISEEEWVRRFIEEFDAEELEGEWDAAEDVHAGRTAASGGERGA